MITVKPSFGTTSAILEPHQPGDLIVIFAYRETFVTPPSLAAGFTDIFAGPGEVQSLRVAYKVAESEEEVSGTWTNATLTVAAVITGTGTLTIGANSGLSIGTSSTIDYLGIDLDNEDFTSSVLAFAAHRNTNVTLETPPTGMLNILNYVLSGTCEIALHRTTKTVDDWDGDSVLTTGATSNWETFCLEIKESDGLFIGAIPVSAIAEILPENPIIETWDWKTDILTSLDAHEEHRIGLRISPRISLGYSALVFNEEERQQNYRKLFSEIQSMKMVPYFQYAAPLTETAISAQNRIYFNMALCDARVGNMVLIYDSSLRRFAGYQISILMTDGVFLNTDLTEDHAKGSFVVPAHESYIQDGSGFAMKNTNGQVDFATILSGTQLLFTRPDAAPTIITFNGLPVFSKRSIVNGSVDEKFAMENKIIDNDVGVFEVVKYRGYPMVIGKVDFKINRYDEPGVMDYWRGLFDLIKGQRGSFYIPTWREDFVLAEEPDDTDQIIMIDNGWKTTYEGKAEFSSIQFMATDGSILYRSITDSEIDGDNLVLTIDSPLTDLPKWRTTSIKCSFLLLSRLNDDKVELQHFSRTTNLSLSTRTIRA